MSHCHDSHCHSSHSLHGHDSHCHDSHCHDAHCHDAHCHDSHCHDAHCHDAHCAQTCCDGHCIDDHCLHGPHVHSGHIVNRSHCHSPIPEVVTTTTNYTVPDTVVQYDTRTVSSGVYPQDPLVTTTVRRSSIRSVGHSHSRHSSRCSSRGSLHHHH